MAGVISPSMPVWIVEDAARGTRAFSNFNEGLGKALRFGAYGPEVLQRLKWIERSLAPALGAALALLGGLELKPLVAQALIMGDEVHNRNAAASALLLRRLAPALARARLPHEELGAGARVHGRQRAFLPQHLHGAVQARRWMRRTASPARAW